MNVPYSSNNSTTTSNIALENQIMINDLSNIVGAIPTDADVLQLTNNIATLELDVVNTYTDLTVQIATLNSTQTTMQLSAQNTSADLGALISDVAALEARVTALGG